MSSQSGQKFSTLDPHIGLTSKDIMPLTQKTSGGTFISTGVQLGALRDFFSMELRFTSVNDGIANTLNTQYFLVINTASNTLDLYRNDNGIAVLVQDEIAGNAKAAALAASSAAKSAQDAQTILDETKRVVITIENKVEEANNAAKDAQSAANEASKSLTDVQAIQKDINNKVTEVTNIADQAKKDADLAQEAANSVLDVKNTLEQVLAFYKVVDHKEITGTEVTIDPNAACMQSLTLTQPNTTINIGELTGPTGIYRQLTLLIKQGTGANLADWGYSVRWSNARKPTLSYRKDAVDLVTLLTVDGGLTWLGMFNGGWFNVQ